MLETHSDGPDAITCSDVCKAFGPTRALDCAGLVVKAGAIHALVGENGAGKTTLMRIIAREIAANSGTVAVSGEIGLVRQHLSTVEGLTALETIAFGAEPSRFGWISWKRARCAITELCELTRLPVPLDRRVTDLPIGVQQRVELLAALYRGASILLLDEPTTHLTPHEVESLFEALTGLVHERGLTVVFVSHKLREIVNHCEAVTVLRRGKTVANFVAPFSAVDVGHAMTGDETDTTTQSSATTNVRAEDEFIVLEALLAQTVPIRVAAGEIIGVAGVAGNGQDDLVAHIAGTNLSRDYGGVRLLETDATSLSVSARRRLGLRIVPADVPSDGVAKQATLVENLLTSEPPRRFRGRLTLLRRKRAAAWADETLKQAAVVYASVHQPAGELSGGNLQRLAVAREAMRDAGVLVVHEPTRGVDFKAAAAIHAQLKKFTQRGGGVLLISSDLDELIELADRIHVLYERHVIGTLERGAFSLPSLGELLGGHATRTAA